MFTVARIFCFEVFSDVNRGGNGNGKQSIDFAPADDPLQLASTWQSGGRAFHAHEFKLASDGAHAFGSALLSHCIYMDVAIVACKALRH